MNWDGLYKTDLNGFSLFVPKLHRSWERWESGPRARSPSSKCKHCAYIFTFDFISYKIQYKMSWVILRAIKSCLNLYLNVKQTNTVLVITQNGAPQFKQRSCFYRYQCCQQYLWMLTVRIVNKMSAKPSKIESYHSKVISVIICPYTHTKGTAEAVALNFHSLLL